MKKIVLFVLAIAFIARASATVHMVAVQDFEFSPKSMNVKLGDTVMWMWVNDVHTTTSTQIPAGAAPWNQNINSGSPSFMYVPTVVGTYNYQCNFHVSLGMTGSFTVVSNTAVAGVSNVGVTVYPNPASGNVNLQFANAAPTSVTLTNVLGSVVYSAETITRETSLNVNDLPNGTYIMSVSRGDLVYKHELLVAH